MPTATTSTRPAVTGTPLRITGNPDGTNTVLLEDKIGQVREVVLTDADLAPVYDQIHAAAGTQITLAPSVVRPARRSDTDRRILTALGLDPAAYRLDRTDPFRVLVVTVSTDVVGGVVGLAVIDDTYLTGGWLLACVGCEGTLVAGEATYCAPCADLLAAEADGADVR